MNVFIYSLSGLLFTFTLLSVVKHDYWVFRVFDYPRLQKLVLSLVCLILIICFFDAPPLHFWLLSAGITANLAYLSFLIFPFTPFSKKQVLNTTKHLPEQSISLMVANVYQDNTNTKGCLAQVLKTNPDVVLLLETNARWDRETTELSAHYAYQVKVPLENTYGMLLYSKLELINPTVKYMVEEDIPSIHCQILLKNGQALQLYALHPTPPVPNENPRSTERDKELLLVADLARESKLPCIVIGDLNDVAWSYTTELFLKMSQLLDPRRGRGFYNSFHAHNPLMRFPLDHAFISADFKLKAMKRLNNCNSDHFPIYIALQYEAAAVLQQQSLEASLEDAEIAEEKKQKI
ncbi:endonuclease/exonuclease/phosphatase family protein [Pedobacter sp. MC2016-14]|uniref:endonuclease/exonuclease/phosphatase family protein n=1 Tax=Pedobacter sp. MC2016-14 TaxID=2897327 RepID=UPI001E28BB79|nr:endonuclease/exonuclease/phosphatase family protein [Pedobacter sp. MC2016-14]MCD0489811.1 endonuclease/exonuclease/phosphatase family protein [Pedobacter sp. MC2016-14]